MNAVEIAKDAIEKKRLITEEENIQMCKELGLVNGEWKGRTSDGEFIRGIMNMVQVGSKVKGQYDSAGKLFAVSIDGVGSFGVNKFLARVALGKITITATRTQYQKWQER